MGVLNKYIQLIKGILLSFRILIIFLCSYLSKGNLIEFLLAYIPSWREKYAYDIIMLQFVCFSFSPFPCFQPFKLS
jgi:hypothetical protein